MPTTRRTSFNRNPSSLSSNATFACAFRGRHLDSPEKLSTFLGTQLPVSRVHCRVPILLRVLTSFLPFSSVYSVDRKSTRLNSSHVSISYAVFCLTGPTSPQFYTPSLHDALPI